MKDFDGSTYERDLDYTRLGKQFKKVFALMQDCKWRSLYSISARTGYPEQSISARLRDFRKAKFGSWEVQRRRRGDKKSGLFQYRLTGKKLEPSTNASIIDRLDVLEKRVEHLTKKLRRLEQ